jgi:hypothetical protein
MGNYFAESDMRNKWEVDVLQRELWLKKLRSPEHKPLSRPSNPVN